LKRVERVLLVEDNAGDARLFAEMMRDLGGDIDVEFADTLTAATTAVLTGGYDVVLLDLGLPESVGLDTYMRFRAAAPDAAVVVLTGNTDLELAVSAVDAGAQDFLVKGQVEAELLGRAMTYAVSRKASEIELRAQARMLEEAQQVAHLGSWRLDPRTREVTLSQEFLRIFGLAPDTQFEAAPELVRRLIHPGHREVGDSDWSEMLGVEEIPAGEYPVERPDGQIRWVSRRASWEFDETGTQTALIGIMQDITERVESQEAIQRSESLNRLLIDGLREHAVLMLSPDGYFAGWNAGAERLFGYTAQQAQGL
jgi:two-component system, NarL family, sensor histidine kinase UhpB